MKVFFSTGCIFVAVLASFLASASLAAKPKYQADFNALEQRSGCKIGVMALDTASGGQVAYREGERFAMCSTFKLLLVSQVLQRVDKGKETLQRTVPYGPADLAGYAPITARHAGEKGMTVEDLCLAAVQYSDSTAANLLLRTQGGPEGLTHYAQSLGDGVTHLDRIEPFLNTPVAGNDLDTTTPAAMAQTLKKVLLGTTLTEPSRQLLERWLLGNTTGATRLKAGIPPTWHIADKTGAGDNGVNNDIGVLYPPGKSPIIIAAYTSGCRGTRADSDAVLANVARLVVNQLP